MNVAGATGAAQYQAQIQALKAVASLIEVNEETFRTLLRSLPSPTIVAGETGAMWFKKRGYLTNYDGFVFFVRVPRPLEFSADAPGAFYVEAESLSIPFA